MSIVLPRNQAMLNRSPHIEHQQKEYMLIISQSKSISFCALLYLCCDGTTLLSNEALYRNPKCLFLVLAKDAAIASFAKFFATHVILV